MPPIDLAEPVLVTGATGFIGRRLVARLRDEGLAVRAFVLPEEAGAAAFEGGVQVVRGDVRDEAAVRKAVRGAGTVFHLAAVVADWGPERLFREVTIGGTKHVLGSAAETDVRAVLVSSIAVYGDLLGRGVCHEDRPHGRPQGPYSRSKQVQEWIARRLERERGLRLSIVRPANVYGPGSRLWVHEAIAHLRRGRPALIGGTPKQAGLVYVDNVVDVLLRATAPKAVGRVYNAAEGNEVTWPRYFTDLAEIAGTPPPKHLAHRAALLLALVAEPTWKLLRLKGRPPVTQEALNMFTADLRIPTSRARNELGYVPRVSYEEGMAAVARFLHNKMIEENPSE